MTSARHMSWDNFRTTVLVKDQQRVHRVTDSPLIEIFGDGALNRIGISLETSADATVPSALARLTFINSRTIKRDNRFFLDLSTSAPALQRQFYHFASAVAERVIVDRLPAAEAITVELKCFTDLLEERALLSIGRQIGLIGELLFLERLVQRLGIAALESWLGPVGEPHDFRVRNREFEVKTTVSTQRIHTIHGTEQLLPSDGCSLSLVSVLLGPPGVGGGFSLAGKAAQLANRFAALPRLQTLFTSALEASGFRASDSQQYTKEYVLRRPMGLVPVDGTFPTITRPAIQSAMGSLAYRIESLQYDVNVEGLEYEDGSAQFQAAFPD